ncbi:tyrosine-type recombinase/integrase [Brucella anthropi]
MPITKNDVDGLTPDTILWDDGRGSVAGFGVRRQRVARVFILKYSVRGRSRWMSIGKYGSPWTVETARLEAKRLLGLVASGGDPAAARDEQRSAEGPLTVAELCDDYMKAARAGAILTRFHRPKKELTLQIDVGRIERHIKPLIGKKHVIEVDSKVVKRLIHDITVGKTATSIKTGTRGRAIVTGGAGSAARVADLLSGIMTWAVDEGLIRDNPVHRVRRYRGQPRQRFLSEVELKQLGKVLSAGRDCNEKAIHRYALTVVHLLVLTGCRLNEIASLRWSEVDLSQRCLRLGDTKTGQSLRAIGSAATKILSNIDKLSGSDWVFPGARGDGPYQGTKREAARIFQTAELDNVTCHTLRHTYASFASGCGYSDGTIAGLLGHKGRGVTSRYIHRPDSALLAAAEDVSEHIKGLLNVTSNDAK